MSAGHGEALYREAGSPIHGLAPQVKLLAVVGFVAGVVAVPPQQLWAFAVLAGAVAVVSWAAGVPMGFVVRRWWAAAPFLAMVPLVALVAQGERLGVGPFSLSRPGLWAAWNIAAKALLGLSATVLLMATTRSTAVVAGLDRLRVPPVFTTTAAFMLRYLQLTLDDARRMRDARLARCDDPRWLWQARGVAATAGTLFVRTYERGERVHRAMLARGYTGRLPAPPERPAAAREWVLGAALPVLAAVVAVAAWAAER